MRLSITPASGARRVNPGEGITVTAAGGKISGVTVRLGRRDVDERIERFIRTASQVIAHRMNEIAYVDMRYSNGFAIGWRNAQAPASTPAKHSDDTDA